MRTIIELKNPDTIEINNQRFQVIHNTSTHYDTKRKELEMVIELVKQGEKHLTPKYRLVYIHERPGNMKFFAFDSENKCWDEQAIHQINLQAQI